MFKAQKLPEKSNGWHWPCEVDCDIDGDGKEKHVILNTLVFWKK